MKAPNGWISHDLYIWNELDRRGFVSKGFVLEIRDLRHGSDRAVDGFYESVRQFLHTLEESTRAQFRWSADSDYRKELLSYNRITEERCEPDSWAAMTRNERFNRYWQAMQSGRLRREKLVLFLSKDDTIPCVRLRDRSDPFPKREQTFNQRSYGPMWPKYGALKRFLWQ